jgi:uncharacterized membrane protein YgaE (UPF0421/DUF939 family)
VVGLLLGVATGIVIGELSLALPDGIPVLKVMLAAFFAMLIAASYGQAIVTPIQSGVSALLIIAFGPATTGSVRMIDVTVGVAVGFVFTQALILEQRWRPKVTDRSPFSEGPEWVALVHKTNLPRPCPD